MRSPRNDHFGVSPAPVPTGAVASSEADSPHRPGHSGVSVPIAVPLTVPASDPSHSDVSTGHRTKRADIQALRAVAVVCVVAYHFFPSLVPAGFVGVDVFFVISGFLISGLLMKDTASRGRVDFAGFYARRAKRILPSAYLTLVFAVGAVVLLLPLASWETTAREGLASIFYVQNIYLAQQSVDYLAEGSAQSVFQHFWSLAAEEQFYLIVPLLFAGSVWATRRIRSRRGVGFSSVACIAIGALAILSLTYSQRLVTTGDPSGYFLITSRFWELALGSVLALCSFTIRNAYVRVGLATIGWLALLGAVLLTSPSSFPGFGALPATVSTAIILVAHTHSGLDKPREKAGVLARAHGAVPGFTWGGRLMNSRAVQHLGNISYNLYLTHWPVLIVLSGLGLGGSHFWLATGLALSYALAHLMYRAIDAPLARIKVRDSNAKSVLLLALVASCVVGLLCVLVVAVASSRTHAAQQRSDQLVQDALDQLGAAQARSGAYEAFSMDHGVIVPLPQQVRHDLPSGADGRCKSSISADFTPTCEFGSPTSDTVIALVGDSHIEQYLPAFERLAAEHDWRIKTYFKASCPFSAGERVTDAKRGGVCQTANEATMTALLNDKDVSLVVTSNRTAVPWTSGEGSTTPEEGFLEYWDRLMDAGKSVAVLADNPSMLPRDETTACVARNETNPGTCARDTNQATVVDRQVAPAEASEVTLIATQEWFCSAEKCPPVIGNVLVYRDEQHISALYAQTLAPNIYEALQPLLAKPQS